MAEKENEANKSTDVLLGTSNTLYPTQNAVKTYVDDISAVFDNAIFDINQDLVEKENAANKSTNVNLGTSNTLYPTQNAVKTYADSLVVGLVDDRGNFDASDDEFPTTGGSGVAGAIMKGDLWFIDTSGTLGGIPVAVGSSIRALVNSPGQNVFNWGFLNTGLGYVPENEANKSTDVLLGTSDILYPSQKAVKTYVDDISAVFDNAIFDLNQDLAEKENAANKSTNVNLGTSNTLYPTQNAVKTYVETSISDVLVDINVDIADLYALKENVANKSTSVNLGTSDILYPSQKAVKTYVDQRVPKIYAVTLSQTGENEPIVNLEYKNDITDTIVWSRFSYGQYIGTITTGEFTIKTFFATLNAEEGCTCTANTTSSNTFILRTYNTATFGFEDGLLNNSQFKIEIYN